MSGGQKVKPRLVELGLPLESWVDGFGPIEHLGGGVFRVPLYKNHRDPSGEEPDAQEIVFYALVRLSKIRVELIGLREVATGILEDSRRMAKH